MDSTNASSNNVKVDDFIIMYNMYYDAGFTWGLAIWALCLNVVGFLGISLNLSIVWITYRTPSMHGTANINLAMGSFFEVLHQMGHWLFLVVTFSGRNFIPYALSVQICSIALWGLGSVALSITFTAMDRLLYVLFPMFTYMVKQKVYLGGICFLCILCSSQNLWIFYKTANEVPASTMISGSIDEILSRNPGKDVYSYYSLVLNFITLGLYITLGLVLKFKPSIMNDTAASRIYKSILVLITVRLSGFFAMRIFRLFIANSIQPYILRWNISESMSLLLNISTASTGPILYSTSSEYRNAFLRQFKPVAKLFYALVGTSKTGPMGISVLHSSAINGGKPALSRKQIVPTPVVAMNRR